MVAAEPSAGFSAPGASRTATELEVRLAEEPVGTLTRTRKGARFAYNEQTVAHFEGKPLLSCALPVKRRPYAEGLTAAWFENLLPEGERLSRVCRAIGCRETDYFEILAHIGWECAGAVSIAEPGFVPPAATRVEPLAEDRLAAMLRTLPDTLGTAKTARVSLGGYQEKAVVVARDLRCEAGRVVACAFGMPDAATVSTHILKPQPANRYAGIIEAEAWAMAVAAAAARCARVALLELDGAPTTLVVERFDRMLGGERPNCGDPNCGRPVRVHQEDCCQAMGLPPANKYANERSEKGDDPSYAKIADLLLRFSIDPAEELDELARQMTVNLALGNVDAHAKNHAFLYRTRCAPTLAPMYDVVPITQVEPSARFLSMRINGKIATREVTGADLVREAQSWGMADSTAAETVQGTLAALDAGVERAGKLYPRAAERFAPGVIARIAELRRS